MSLRETLGRIVRDAWVEWAGTQADPKPSWLAPWDEMPEPIREADRQIGMAVFQHVFDPIVRILTKPLDQTRDEVKVMEPGRSNLDWMCLELWNVRVDAKLWRDQARTLAIQFADVRDAVQRHHDQGGDNRCHLDDVKLYYDVLGVGVDPYAGALPPDTDMLESCRRYIAQRRCPGPQGVVPLSGDMTIEQLTEEVERLRVENDRMRKRLGVAEGGAS